MRLTAVKWIKRISIAFGILIAIVIALPFFIKLDNYIPQIEEAISAKLKEPVKIQSIHFFVLPSPHLTIDGISVGKSEDIKLGKVTATPQLFSLLSATKVVRALDIDSLVLTQRALEMIPVWSKPTETQQAPQLRIESIRLDNALVKLDKANFGPFDARVRLNTKGEPDDASVTMRDGKLKLLVKPDNSNYLIEANAKSWKPPVGPPIEFDELVMKGIATLTDASFNDVSAKLYGGTVKGRATVGWDKGLQLKGNFDINRVELKELVPMLASGTNISGKLNARPVFSASAAQPNQLVNALRLETSFNIEQGVLYGVDIQKAATNLLKQGTGGGETRFDQLSGHLNLERGAYRFTELKIASGVLAADGNVNISPKKELSGRVNAEVKVVGASASVPLNVAGTVSAPLLYPTGASLAGAAVGTAILGPGLGTAVGEKIGNFAEGLFSKKNEKKEK